MTDISQKSLERIQQSHTTPKPWWQVVLRHVSIWVAVIAAIVIVSIAVGLTIHLLTEGDLGPALQAARWWVPLFTIIPYVWLIVLAVGGVAAIVAYRHTQHGYRYHGIMIGAGILGIGVVLAVGLFASGATRKIDGFLMTCIPAYERIVCHQDSLWSRPQHGLIAGTVVQTARERIILRDRLGNEWNVVTRSPLVDGYALGDMIKMIGQRRDTDDYSFEAQRIIPWRGMVGYPRPTKCLWWKPPVR